MRHDVGWKQPASPTLPWRCFCHRCGRADGRDRLCGSTGRPTRGIAMGTNISLLNPPICRSINFGERDAPTSTMASRPTALLWM